MKKRILALLGSILILVSTIVTPVCAESVHPFIVKVSDVAATAGDSRVAVDILLENNPGIAGFSFCVNYDTDKLVLVTSDIHLEDGYQVIAQPTGYGVNLAWTGPAGYAQDGKIATLYFNILENVPAGDVEITLVYRAGYDSFYNAAETDLPVQTINGKISIAARQASTAPAVNVGEAVAGSSSSDIVVPIMVENNVGFAGFSFCVNYDTSRLVLTGADILIDGYKVVAYPEGYGVNLAWTGTDTYTQNGTIAQLHFSLKDGVLSGKAYVDVLLRDHYDSFYTLADGEEQDIAFASFAGYVSLSSHRFGSWTLITPATCSATGMQMRVCLDCALTETKELPKTPHDYVELVTKPTCTEQGYTTHTCKLCSDYYVDTYVNEVGHVLGEWEILSVPQCEDKGQIAQKCTTCNEVVNYDEIAALGHNIVQHGAQAPTCTAIGWNAYETCSRCDHSTYVELPALGHDYDAVVTAPGCENDGYTTYTCSACGDTYVDDEIAALGHSMVHHGAQAPTCTAIGWNAYEICSRCDHSTYVEIPVLEHVYDDDNDADCNVCGAVREIVTVLPGDANGDGRVNNRDLGLLQQHLAEWDVTINLDACDLNNDGRINNRDLGLLQQYLAE